MVNACSLERDSSLIQGQRTSRPLRDLQSTTMLARPRFSKHLAKSHGIATASHCKSLLGKSWQHVLQHLAMSLGRDCYKWRSIWDLTSFSRTSHHGISTASICHRGFSLLASRSALRSALRSSVRPVLLWC